MGKQKESVSIQAAWYFVGRAMAVVVSVLVPVILVRIFSKEDFGVYRQAMLLYFFLSHILQFGIRHSLFYFLPCYPENQHRYVVNTLLCFLCLGFLNLVLLSYFSRPIARVFNAAQLQPLLPFIGVYVLMMLVATPFETVLIIRSKAKTAAVTAFTTELARGACMIILVTIFGTLFWGVIALLIYASFRCAIYVSYVVKVYGITIDKENWATFRAQVHYAAPMGFAGLIGNTSKRLGQFVVSALFGPIEFAIYSAGRFQVPFVNTFFQSVGEAVLPRMVEHLRANDREELLKLWHKLLQRMCFVGIGSFFLFQLLAYDLITLVFTEQYASSVPVFRVVIVLLLANMLSYGLILRSLGHTRDILAANIFAFAAAVILTYPLARYFGVVGAAMSSVTVFCANAGFQLVVSAKRLKLRFRNLFPIGVMLKLTLIAGTLSLALFVCQEMISLGDHLAHKILRLGASTATFLAFYLYLCHKTQAMSVLQEEAFQRVVSGIRAGLRRAT